MFTGLIEAIGTVEATPSKTGDGPFRVRTALAAELEPGASIAVNGVCLTVASRTQTSFDAVLSPETLRVTTLGRLGAANPVNLERPVRADGRMGGHFVLGHVDAVARFKAIVPDADCYWIDVELPVDLMPYLILKGSVALDGISLTVAGIENSTIRVQIVPHTWTHTTLSSARVGDATNVETDVIGKYVVRLLGDRLSHLELSGLAALAK